MYRLWDNERVSDEAIRKAHVQATCRRCLEQPVVLAIQDTADLDFTGHPATQGQICAESLVQAIGLRSNL